MIDLSRRGFIGGLAASVIAAPTVVRAASLMPIRGIILPTSGLITDWLPCDGRLVSANAYPELYAVLHHTFDGRYYPRERKPLFRLPGYEEDHLRNYLQPEIAAEMARPEFRIATRETVLPSGIIVGAGTVRPIDV